MPHLDDETYQRVLARLDRNLDGSIPEKSLIDALAEEIVVDPDEEARRIAKQYVDQRSRDGRTPPEGSLVLPGMEPFPYEPQRLVRGNDGNVIEQEKALPPYKFAEADRKRRNAQAASRKADRAQKDAEMFAEWAMDQESGHRRYGVYVHDAGIWVEGESEAEPDEDGAA